MPRSSSIGQRGQSKEEGRIHSKMIWRMLQTVDSTRCLFFLAFELHMDERGISIVTGHCVGREIWGGKGEAMVEVWEEVTEPINKSCPGGNCNAVRNSRSWEILNVCMKGDRKNSQERWSSTDLLTDRKAHRDIDCDDQLYVPTWLV